jgi:GNAT superfamily N-acetyltransferase
VKARKLTAQQFVPLIKSFCEAHGMEQIKASYGWDAPSTTMFKGETVWEFSATVRITPDKEDAIIGWGSMHFNTRDAEEGDATLIVGVFPEFQGNGYRTKILDWMSARAKKLGATTASMIVYKANEKHYKRVMREVRTDGSPWLYAGDVWLPAPGYGMFTRPL